MAEVLIFHGTTSRPERSWFPWLTWRLLEAGHSVHVPRLPTPAGQSLASWEEATKVQVPDFEASGVWVGHSTGAPFALRLLEKFPVNLKALFLVSSFARPLGIPDYDPLIASFVEPPWDWELIRKRCSKVFVFHGDNDPYVPEEFGETVASHLDASFFRVTGGKHLNTEAGFTQFSELYNVMSGVLKE